MKNNLYEIWAISSKVLQEKRHPKPDELVKMKTAIMEMPVAPSGMEESSGLPSPPQPGLLDRIHTVLSHRHHEAGLDVAAICRELGMSRPTLNRRLKELTGLSIKEHLQCLRLNRAATQLQSSKDPVCAIAYDCGFTDPNYFCRSFVKKFKQTPTQYRASRPT